MVMGWSKQIIGLSVVGAGWLVTDTAVATVV